MKKTLLVTTDYLPATGGVANYWARLKEYLPDDQFLVLAPKKNSNPLHKPDLCSDSNSAVLRTDFYSKLIWPRWVGLISKIYRVCKDKKIETVIAGQILPIGIILYFLKATDFIKSYYVSCHGMDLAGLRGRKRELAKVIFKNSEKVMVNSRYTKKLALDLGVLEGKIFIIYPCPNQLPDSDLDIKLKHKIKTDNIVLTVSRLVARKGIDMVIKAMPKVWLKFPDAVYVIVGSGSDKERLKNIIKENIKEADRDKIIFAGEVKDEELAAYYKSAKMFIMPTRDIDGDIEGFGMVYLEAGLYDLPVIASAVGGAKESVKNGETGLMVNDNDSDEIGQAVIDLLTNEDLRQELGKNNKFWAQSFSWKDQAKKLEAKT